MDVEVGQPAKLFNVIIERPLSRTMYACGRFHDNGNSIVSPVSFTSIFKAMRQINKKKT